ncbi:hypothetical protein FEM48_Zijuj06G0165800 [Ziziphus jujuba var. spinosa]|uniref:Glucuronoxylan 4-O-methyltransferase 3-like n=1 Tax=Ziziphus jujuba var. spinosa TaxID=714518 RepID=A0A978VAE2_ZIZJJ|nr:hypothetical protein FEM48_Zijuj06G0165800 [Ziziphus jujuba var. spinosa]
MRSNSKTTQFPVSIKLILLSLFFIFLLVLVIRSGFTPQQAPLVVSETHLTNSITPSEDPQSSSPSSSSSSSPCPTITTSIDKPLIASTTCGKAPPSLANAIIHYATTNITPQQTFKEISVSSRILEKKSPCNFLIFGLGHDSLMWTSLNHGGRTIFLEEDKAWIDQIKERIPSLEAHHVTYDTKVHQAEELLKLGEDDECKTVSDPRSSKCQLALKNFPNEVYEIEWDLIMVDAPTGYFDGAPGRMSAIYTAGLMARNRESGETDVFVHDVDRVVEDKFSKTFLCEGYLTEQEGRIRHFIVPSHRTRSGRPFCP